MTLLAPSRQRLPGDIQRTDLPARLDRLPWGRFHTLLVIALGITWLLDGLEVTLAGAVAGALRQSPALHLSSADIGLAGGVYIAGAVYVFTHNGQGVWSQKAYVKPPNTDGADSFGMCLAISEDGGDRAGIARALLFLSYLTSDLE